MQTTAVNNYRKFHEKMSQNLKYIVVLIDVVIYLHTLKPCNTERTVFDRIEDK